MKMEETEWYQRWHARLKRNDQWFEEQARWRRSWVGVWGCLGLALGGSWSLMVTSIFLGLGMAVFGILQFIGVAWMAKYLGSFICAAFDHRFDFWEPDEAEKWQEGESQRTLFLSISIVMAMAGGVLLFSPLVLVLQDSAYLDIALPITVIPLFPLGGMWLIFRFA